jgi:hypothetical protein
LKNRIRLPVHTTVPRDVLEMLDELSKVSGWNKARCVEECVRVAYPILIKKLRESNPMTVKKSDKPSPEDEERAREEYWKKVILGNLKDREWVSMW